MTKENAQKSAVCGEQSESRENTRLTTKKPVSAQQEPVWTSTTTAATTPKQGGGTSSKVITTTPRSTQNTTTTEKEIIYVEIEDETCLKSMVESLEETDTPPSYYEQIGRELKHNGTDYGKAVAVYKYMIENGWGNCVYHAMETYFVCKGAGLECAYAFCTENGWYGHTYNVIRIDGEWYVLDTQGRCFLDNTSYPCIRIFDGNDNDLPPYDEWVCYPYDEDGGYRDLIIETVN